MVKRANTVRKTFRGYKTKYLPKKLPISFMFLLIMFLGQLICNCFNYFDISVNSALFVTPTEVCKNKFSLFSYELFQTLMPNEARAAQNEEKMLFNFSCLGFEFGIH